MNITYEYMICSAAYRIVAVPAIAAFLVRAAGRGEIECHGDYLANGGEYKVQSPP
jgi:hypothetical protein